MLDPLPTLEPSKCKSHLFKEAYDEARKQKLQAAAMKNAIQSCLLQDANSR
jgi:hypothetical protein